MHIYTHAHVYIYTHHTHAYIFIKNFNTCSIYLQMLANWLFEAPQLLMPETGFTQATKQTLACHAKVRTKFVNINLLK